MKRISIVFLGTINCIRVKSYKISAFLLLLLSGNFLPQIVNGQAIVAENATVDSLIQNFIPKYDIPALSITITKDGNLVFAKAYGKADVAKNTNATTESLFRIASVSKPITAAAIMKLVEMGKLSLDDKVFGKGSILGNKYGKKNYNKNLLMLTVRHLLTHRGGGWTNDRFDPMFQLAGKPVDKLISWTIWNNPLENPPGQTYKYSNFGYAILGQIIEKRSGQKYEAFVKKEILKPAGIKHMQIAANSSAGRKVNEVTYYGQNGRDPYKDDVTRSAACGGWIASATDLARFLVSVDGFPTKPDILTEKSINEMTGWMLNASNHWSQSGGMTGTSSVITRLSTGWNIAVLCNSRSDKENFNTELGQVLNKILKSIKNSEIDLFSSNVPNDK